MNESIANGSAETRVDELYDHSIKVLPVAARLQLAARILSDIPPQAVVDYRTDWSEEDQHDVTRYSMSRAAASFGEEQDA